MKYKSILGCDPGLSGAIAVYFPDHPNVIAIHDMPVDGKSVDGYELAKIIRQYNPEVAFVEKVHSMPNQGVASTFTFGESYGAAKGVLSALNIPIELVTPRQWKKEFELTSDKNESLELARMFWPDSDKFKRKKDNGRAEAALIAMYGYKLQFNVRIEL